MDVSLFVMAIFYGFFMDGAPDYRVFNHEPSYLKLFRFMLFWAWLLYVGIAWFGGAAGMGLFIYAIYILGLLMREEWVYFKKIRLKTSFWKIVSIEIVREVILIAAGFWPMSL